MTTDDETIRALHAARISHRRIAQQTGLSPWAVRKRLEAMGLRSDARSGPPTEGRSVRVPLYLTPAEAAEVKAWALVRGQPVATAVREVVLEAVKGRHEAARAAREEG